MDDAPEEGDVLLMHNIFTSEVLILHINRLNDHEGCNHDGGKMSKVRFKDIFLFLIGGKACSSIDT